MLVVLNSYPMRLSFLASWWRNLSSVVSCEDLQEIEVSMFGDPLSNYINPYIFGSKTWLFHHFPHWSIPRSVF